jgi:hypothetical protein
MTEESCSINWRAINLFSPQRPALPPIQYLSGAASLGVKRPETETNHSLLSNAVVMNVWSYISAPLYDFVVIMSNWTQDKFIFLFALLHAVSEDGVKRGQYRHMKEKCVLAER